MADTIESQSTPGVHGLIALNPDGSNIGGTGSLGSYYLSGIDGSSPAYFGYTDANGNWFIKKLDLSAGTTKYAKGTSGYTTAWTARASQSYDYFYNVW